MTFDEAERKHEEELEPSSLWWEEANPDWREMYVNPDWSDCFSTSKHEEDAWEEIEMDNALMERGL